MKIEEIMTKNVYTVTPEMEISSVVKILKEHKIHGVPVVDGKHLVGIITETDFFTKGDNELHLPSYIDFLKKTGLDVNKEEINNEEFNSILNAKAEDIMSTECITLNPEDDVKVFLKIVKENEIHTAPVTIGDILVGIITVADVIKLL